MAMRIVVVFPAPLDPQNPNIEPGATAKPTPSRTRTVPKLLCSPSNSSTRPPAMGVPAPHRIGSSPSRRAPRCGVIDGMSQENEPARPPSGVGLDGLRSAAAGCRACELWEPATQTVFGEGPETARIVFVGEQPGDQEDRQGEPFVGPAGRLLDRALADAGIDRGRAYLTNAVKHFKFVRREGGKRRIHETPTAGEISACRPWLAAELRIIQPEVVVALGAVAGKALLGPAFRVTRQRGVPLPLPPVDLLGTSAAAETENTGGRLVATIHPSAVLRAEDRDAVYAGLVADLAVAARLLD
jgi:DNA polymerase